jgi:hypothetical protein
MAQKHDDSNGDFAYDDGFPFLAEHLDVVKIKFATSNGNVSSAGKGGGGTDFGWMDGSVTGVR